jgi:hypothetical protein
VQTAQYELQRQAMATLVQERSGVPAMTLPVFNEDEVQADFIFDWPSHWHRSNVVQ